jgi:pimeloyl-ACP methyl ester carboxylesterase
MQANVHGIEIGYDLWGEGETTLLLLHAFPLNRQQMREQGEELARRAHVRVVAMDLRGFGESSLEVGPTTMDQYASDVADLMGVLHLDSVVLGGLSLGGYAAFQCLREFPQRIQGLLLADTRATADTPDQRAAREETALYVEAHNSAAVLDRDAGKFFSPGTLAHHPEIVEWAREIAALNSDIGVAAAARGMALRGDSTDLLTRIYVPTLVLVGDLDAITPTTDSRAMAELIPDAELELITGAGHLSNLERPEAFTGAVARFLSQRLGVALI